MIDKLRSIAVFAAVVDQGSFRAAALTLGLAPSRVSEVVSQLEKDLGVTLLYRSTRQLSLTNEGRRLKVAADDMLGAVETGLDAISPLSGEPSGALKVTVPAFVTQTELMDDFARFASTYPKVELDFHFSDRPSDVIRDGFDVAIRAGWLDDSDLMVRTIGHVDRFLVASPQYYDAMPTPTDPSDLEDWQWIRFVMRTDQTEMTSKDGQVVKVLGKSSVSVNSASALYEFSVRGLGLTAIPEHLACRGFDRGELIHVLPEWTMSPLGLHAIWPNQSRRENLTTLFVRFLAGKAQNS
ncbi:LysR family transcriptional regulator [uncultured Tateyamaria sp.]|uniref:LysR family transcriptional regulator n=1 Tax=uncultured Tateyamaria sp. TaxID=455651 RepID=UPI0026200D41|nr:LysR family transcriptional regulator [uncultured Tateyamaria sp.]